MKQDYKRLSFGPHVGVSFANLEDYVRYRIDPPRHLEWGYQWIKERMSLSGPVGLLQHSTTNFSFDSYLPIKQIHPYHNVIAMHDCFFSSCYMKVRGEMFESLDVQDYYSDICCPLQFHVLSEDRLEQFVKKSARALKEGGNLLLSFNLWLGCDVSSKEILRSSKVLRRNNKQVYYPLGIHYDTILKLSSELYLIDSNNKEVMNLPEAAMEKILSEDERIVSQHSRAVFKHNFPEEDQQYLQVSNSVRSLAGCLWFKKHKAG